MDRDDTLTHALSISRACHRPGTQWHLTTQLFNQGYKNQISFELHHTQDYVSLLIQKTAHLSKRQEVQYTHTHRKQYQAHKYIYSSAMQYNSYLKSLRMDLPGGPVVKNLPVNAGDMGSVPGLGTKIPNAGGNQAYVPHKRSSHTTTSKACTLLSSRYAITEASTSRLEKVHVPQ